MSRPFVPASPDAVLTKDEVARWLRVHPRTIQRLVHGEGLPVLSLTARQPRFLVRAVQAWLAERSRAA